MKKIFKLFTVGFVLIMVTPLMGVNALTKTDQIVEKMRELVASFEGTVNYENDTIEISWESPNSKMTTVSFSYDGNIIEYSPGEITTYEEATIASNHYLYALTLIEATLKVNGYSEEQIEEFFNNAEDNITYDRNGFELKEVGDPVSFTSPEGDSTIQVSQLSIKLDVTRANISTEGDAPVEPKETTVEDVVEYLQSDEEFTVTEYDGEVIYENEITSDEETITIYHTYYWKDYYNLRFNCEDDILTYEDGEFESYDDAEIALSHQFFATEIIGIALNLNGHTDEEIQEFFASEENSLDYELNGIEIKELGESKEFTSSDGDSHLYVTPMKIKVDFAKANLNKINSYSVLEGANQTITTDKELTFRFNIEYSKFISVGKVYIDGKLVDSSNYTSKEGSTIITFNNNYVKTLSEKAHTLKVSVDDGEVETEFTVSTTNPKTADNIILYTSILGLSFTGLVILGLYIRKYLTNK